MKENKTIKGFEESLKKVCYMSGIGMCPGCGLMPEGFEYILLTHTKEVLQELLEECEGRKEKDLLEKHNFASEEDVLEWDKPEDVADYFKDKGYNNALTEIQNIIREKLGGKE